MRAVVDATVGGRGAPASGDVRFRTAIRDLLASPVPLGGGGPIERRVARRAPARRRVQDLAHD